MASRALPDLRARLQFDTTDLGHAESAARGFGSRLTGHFRPAEESVGRLSATFKNLGVNIAAGLGIYTGLSAVIQGVGGAISSTVTSGIKFQDTMNTLQAVTGANTAQMRALSERAIALGADLSLPNTSAADAATAMTELAKAGLSVHDSMAAAKGVLQLAAAAQVSEGDAAQYAAAALNAFHLPGEQANRIADLLAASANASAASIQEMGDAMRQSAAVFAAAHIPVEDLVTAIAELANAGIRGQDAGTSLKQALLQLQTPSKQQATLLKELNVHLYDASGRMVSLRNLIGQLQIGTQGLTQQQRDYALGVIFGSDAIRIANVLISEGTAGFDKMKEAVTKAGAAQDVAQAKARGLGGAVRGLQSEWETLQLILFLKVAPALETVVRFAADRLPAVQAMIVGWADALSRWGDQIGSLVGRIQSIGTTVPGNKPTRPGETGTDATAIARAAVPADTAESVGKAIADAIVKQAGRIATALMEAFRTAAKSIDWETLGHQVGLQLPLFIVGFLAAQFDPVAIALNMADSLRAHPGDFAIVAVTLASVALAPARVAALLAEAVGKIPFVGFVAAPLVRGLNSLGGPAREAIGAVAGRVADGFLIGFQDALRAGEGGWLVGVSRLIDLLAGLPARSLRIAEDIGVFFGQALGHGLQPAVNVVRVTVREIDFTVTSLIGRMADIAIQAMGGFRAWLGIIGEQALIGIRLLVERLIGLLDSLTAPFRGAAINAMGGVRDIFVSIGEQIWGHAVALWSRIFGFLVERWSAIVNAAFERFSFLRDVIRNLGEQIWNHEVELWSRLFSFLSERWSSIVSTAATYWSALKSTITYWAETTKNAVGGIWDAMTRMAGEAGNNIWNAIKRGLNEAIGVYGNFRTAVNDKLGTFGVNLPEIKKMATGGVMGGGPGFVTNGPVLVGEGKGREWVIPEDPSYRGNALALLKDAALALGIYGLAGGGIRNWLPNAGAMVQGPGGSYSHQRLNAWDYPVPMFSPLFAGLPGTSSQYTSGYGGGYGNSILFNLDQGGQLILAHLAAVLARGHVDAGALIGLTDNTGASTGPHLHFEVRGSALNPQTGGYSGGLPGLAGMVTPIIDIKALIRTALSPLTGAAHAAANTMSNVWARGLANSIIDKIANNILARENGGPVVPGRVYRVGEQGPELFTSSSAGNITPTAGGDNRAGEMVDVLGSIDRRLARIEGADTVSTRTAGRRF